ncbi:carbonic anhydrase 1-like [Brevipalpus obovatus]|uniref:carbonic anhydrase 1-like n=1 Tax=Brevipalpus obovatus TaxID=246614 RepID=UPI003D9F262D
MCSTIIFRAKSSISIFYSSITASLTPTRLIFIFLGFSFFCHLSQADSKWDYTDQYQWGDVSGMCNGTRQSPINIDRNQAKLNTSLKLTLLNYDLPYLDINKTNLTNSGHHVAITDFPANKMIIGGSALYHMSFTLLEIHWHWSKDPRDGSEHAIDGERFASEIHFFHRNLKYSTPEEASKYEDGFATLGVLLELGEENAGLAVVLKSFQNMNNPTRKINPDEPIRLGDLLPKNRESFYTYHGSKTTPTCDESNTWIIFKERMTISEEQLNRLTQFYGHGETSKLIRTNRHLQQQNDRIIYQSDTGTSLKPLYSTVLMTIISILLIKNLG